LGTPIGVLEGHSGYVCSLVFSPDGKTLAAGSSDQTIRLWNTDGLRPLRTLVGHKGAVLSLALLPDNRTLVSGCSDGSVCVWDTKASGRASPHVRLPETFVGWSFAADGQTVLTCDRQGRVAQWKASDFTEERLFEVGTNVSAATFLPERSMVVVAGVDGGEQAGEPTQWHSGIQVWDLQTPSLLRKLTLPNSPPQLWFCLAQGNRLIIGDAANQSLHEWDLTTWEKVHTWPAPAQLYSGTLSPDGRWCVTLGFGGASMINDLTTGRTKAGNFEVRQHSGVTFSADGKLLAVVSIRGSGGIWDAATLQPVGTLRGSQGGDNAVAFSPDGQRLATCGLGKETLTLWNVESHEELLTLGGRGTRLSPPSFSPDGAVLGSMNVNGVLHLWRAPSWAEIEAAEKGTVK
jgi:WD40 repeat protein